jgi:hypothetical protein
MKTRTKILIFVAIITIVMVVQFLMPDLGQTHIIRIEPTGHSVSYSFDASPSFHANNSRFFYFVQQGGVTRRASNEEAHRWNISFGINFSHPVTAARGDILAVGEQSGGRVVYVFNADGLLFRADFEYPVLTFSVNEAGMLSVILQTSVGHEIFVHNQQSFRDREPLYNERIVGTLRRPVAVEVSPNGRYIAVAILDVSVSVDTWLEFRYMNEQDSRMWGLTFGLFGAELFNMQIIYALRFMEDNRLIVATTSQISCHQITSSPYLVSSQQQIWSVDLQNDLTHIGFSGNRHLVYVTGDRHAGATDSSPVGTVHIVNTEGTQVGEFNIGRRVTHLSVSQNAVLVGADRNFHAIDLRGGHLWEHNTLHDTRGIIFLEDTDTILVAGATSAEVHRRRRVRIDDFEDIFNINVPQD